MIEIADEGYARPVADDDREPLPLVGSERDILTSFLDFPAEPLS